MSDGSKRERLVVIGGVAAGMSAASQAKRRRRDMEVIALERGEHVSYGACGMPYNIEDPDRDITDLVVIDAKTFREKRGIDLRVQHEVVRIDTGAKRVDVRDTASGEDYTLDYDHLVIATGARAIRLPVAGADLDGVLVLRDLDDGARVKQFLAKNAPKRAVIVGGGYIGMEMAEVLRVRGLEVTVVERLPNILPGYEDAVVDAVREELARHEVDVHTDTNVTGFRGESGRVTAVETSAGDLPADIVLVAVGVRPNAEIASAAGIALGESGAIAVDEHMRTSAPNVYSAGDCAEAMDLVAGAPTWIPLGTTANKQGKVAGANAAGAEVTLPGIVGTSIFKVFDMQVGRTGLTPSQAHALGIETVAGAITGRTRAHGYPDAVKTTVWLLAEAGSGRLLGAQVFGGEAVKGRTDVLATALHAGMTLDQVGALDLSYAPPLSPVWDPVLIAASIVAKKVVTKKVVA